jgi:hypothetical protein
MLHRQWLFIIWFLGWSLFSFPATGVAREKQTFWKETAAKGAAILWTNPADIESRDLFYGPGGRSHVPRGTLTFIKEDLKGTSPKLVVKDQDEVRWKIKVGAEARPETAASRIVWAVGYWANGDYFVGKQLIRQMPARLRRGQNLLAPDGSVLNARLKREPADGGNVGTWRWRSDVFTGTRELNGLRTLMAVLNNWDLKDENNAIYPEPAGLIYAVKDLGASFGCAGLCWPRNRMKGDLEKYSRSIFHSPSYHRQGHFSNARPAAVHVSSKP